MTSREKVRLVAYLLCGALFSILTSVATPFVWNLLVDRSFDLRLLKVSRYAEFPLMLCFDVLWGAFFYGLPCFLATSFFSKRSGTGVHLEGKPEK